MEEFSFSCFLTYGVNDDNSRVVKTVALPGSWLAWR